MSHILKGYIIPATVVAISGYGLKFNLIEKLNLENKIVNGNHVEDTKNVFEITFFFFKFFIEYNHVNYFFKDLMDFGIHLQNKAGLVYKN